MINLISRRVIKKIVSQILFWFLFFFGLSYDLFSQTNEIELVDQREDYSLGRFLYILEDPESKWTLADVSKEELDKKFTLSKQDIPSFGFTESTYWTRIKISNQSKKENWILEFGFPITSEIEVFLPTEKGYETRTAGMIYPFNKREIPNRKFLFLIKLQTNTKTEIYLKVKNKATLQIPLKLWSYQKFYENDHNEQIIFGFYFGIIFVMAIYNLFIFISVRDKGYIYYVLFIVSSGLFTFQLIGSAKMFVLEHNKRKDFICNLSFFLS